MIDPQDQPLTVFKALAHESRLRLLGHLSAGEQSVQVLARLLELKEPTVSHHLALLREAGLVTLRQDGNTHWYGLDKKNLSRLSKKLFAPDQFGVLAASGPKPPFAERMVQNYVTADGRLKAFPATLKKRRPILAWLARQFDEGQKYSEQQVNELIERRHHDRETFRRELIAHKMLDRKNGIYWRRPENEWVV